LSLNQNEPTSGSETQANQARSFGAAFFAVAILAGVFAWHSLPGQQRESLALADMINPNTATIESLVRLPGVGRARAEAIIWLRESVRAVNGGHPFNSSEDMQRVGGIGPKIAGRIGKSATFEGEQ
jgi:competence protein ComEA